MNIIYKLTNLENNKGYIGQKTECDLINVDGVPSIIHMTSGEQYLGMSRNPEMQEALRQGVVFSAEILEIIPKECRTVKFMTEREYYWVKKLNAVDSSNYYNMAYPIIHNKDRINPKEYLDLVKNIHGETYREYISSSQALSRRINTAKSLGYADLTDFYKDVLVKEEQGLTKGEISINLGKHRHFISAIVESKWVNMSKSVSEKDFSCVTTHRQIVKLRSRGLSIYKISEVVGLETDTVVRLLGTTKVIRVAPNKDFLVAVRKGITPEELGRRIIIHIIEGKEDKEVAKIEDIRLFEVKRYLYKYIREHIKINDLSGIKVNG